MGPPNLQGSPQALFPGRLHVGSPDRRGESSLEIHRVTTRPDKGQLSPQALGGCSGRKTNVHLKGKTHKGTVAFPRSPLPWATRGHRNVGALPGCGPASGAGGPRGSGLGGAAGGRPWASFPHCSFLICISSSASNSMNLGVRRPSRTEGERGPGALKASSRLTDRERQGLAGAAWPWPPRRQQAGSPAHPLHSPLGGSPTPEEGASGSPNPS